MTFSNRNFGLDLIRAIAIFLVLFHHAGLNPFPIQLGRFGVELFFVLSGFLIGNILLRDFENLEGVKTVKTFWARRWFRTLPLYYLALVVQMLLNDGFQKEYFYYFFFLQNNFFGISLYQVSWSLVIEEWFYLGLPFLFFIAQRYFGKVSIPYLIGSIVFFILFKLLFVFFKDTPLDGINSNILLRYDTMLFGVLAAAIYRYKRSLFFKINNIKIFFISVFFAVLFQIFHIEITEAFGFTKFEPISKALFFSFNSFFIALSIPYWHSGQFIKFKLSKVKLFNWCITWLSILSYGLYLFHLNISHFTSLFYNGVFKFPFDLVLGLVICYFIHIVYEKPMTSLRDQGFIKKILLKS